MLYNWHVKDPNGRGEESDSKLVKVETTLANSSLYSDLMPLETAGTIGNLFSLILKITQNKVAAVLCSVTSAHYSAQSKVISTRNRRVAESDFYNHLIEHLLQLLAALHKRKKLFFV